MAHSLLDVNGLAAGYNGNAVVKDISFSAECGEMITLIGPNGAGKSTVLRTIAAQLPPVSGTVSYFGKSVSEMTAREISTKASILLTERISAERMTCKDVVDTGRYPYTGRLGILSSSDHEAVLRAMELTSVDDIADKSFSCISDGQRQLVMLARAVAQDTKLLILDEPTSYLDIGHKLNLLELLRKLIREKNITVIQSLHELDLAQKFSDKIICINNGCAEMAGTPDEVFTDSRINSMFHIQYGSYNTLFGSTETGAVSDEPPKVFVIGGGGCGLPVYRRLRRQGIPFAAGIIPENDAEFSVVSVLTPHVISVPAFQQANAEAIVKAKEMILKCSSVICCRDDVCEELKNYADSLGKLNTN